MKIEFVAQKMREILIKKKIKEASSVYKSLDCMVKGCEELTRKYLPQFISRPGYI
jgi:hypothetical protein